ncbi:MAG TPA: hypothetical protein VI546_02220, partial [candidate division Zixibacteria bacterium]|nr:hypothetical protein [candidate division Zixibacteria bacterium]
MKEIKIPYKVAFSILIILWVFLECLIFRKTEEDKRLDRMIQVTAPFVALLSGIIALANSDKKMKLIKAEITPKIIAGGDRAEYKVSLLPETVQKDLKTSKEIIHSYQVTFVIKNISDFSFKMLTISFRLPLSLRQPEKNINRQWYLRFNSNVFNSQQELRILEFQETLILSNSNLPYLNAGEEINFWIRMCLD